MGTVGCAEEYEVFLMDSYTQQAVTTLPWQTIRWQRVKNNVSIASIDVPYGPLRACCAGLGGLFPLKHFVAIERDGTTVWDGPVTRVSHGGIVTLTAEDRLYLLYKRLVALNRTIPSVLTVSPADIVQLMADAGIGNPAYDPWPIVLPSAPTLPAEGEYQRIYKVDRLERLYDVISEFLTSTGFLLTQSAATMHIDPIAARSAAGAAGRRPTLNEDTAVTIPSVEVDGSNLATAMYVATASQGKAGFPIINSAATLLSTYVPGLVDKAFNVQRDSNYELGLAAQYEAWNSATPSTTIEQVTVAPSFGGPDFDPDLSGLIPGTIIDIDFQDSCAFDVPVSLVDWEFRVPVTDEVEPPAASYFRTPLLSSSLRAAQLGQVDVVVTREEGGGIQERINLSLTSWADWDGTIPSGWIEPILIEEFFE